MIVTGRQSSAVQTPPEVAAHGKPPMSATGRRRIAQVSRALRRLRDPGDLLWIARAFGFAIFVPLLMRLSLRQVETILEPGASVVPAGPGQIARLIQDVELVLAWGRPLVRPGCLTRGATLYYVLRRAGLDVALCFGVGEIDGAMEGHCWLTKDGEPFLERRDPSAVFAELYRVPSRKGHHDSGESSRIGRSFPP